MPDPQNFFDQFDTQTPAQARATAEERRKEAEEKRKQAEEKRKQAEFDAQYGNIPVPGDPSKTGDEYLATLPPGLAAQVKAIAEGRRAFPTGYSMRSPQVQRLVAAAVQYDPTIDAANAATRVATRKDFTSGKAAQNMTSINTAIGHLITLRNAARDLDNSSIRLWNAVANRALTETGDPRVRKFQVARQAVASELTRAFRGTGGSLTEVKDWEAAINEADSPEQLDKAISQATELLTSRLESMETQYRQGMGRSGSAMQFLTPKNQKLLDDLLQGRGVQNPEERTADVFQGPEKGSMIAPEDIKGWRYKPESEQAILDVLRDPNGTPEAVAKVATDAAVAEGHVPQERRNELYQRNLGAYTDYFKKATPEQRAKVSSLDYTPVDTQASENAGLLESVAQSLRNIPESAAQLAQGLIALPGSAIASGFEGEPVGATKAVIDLASEMGSGPTTEAFKDVMAERYGSGAALKRTAIRDPLGLAGDVSIPLTLGGSLAARAPGMAGRIGEAAAAMGRGVDPLNMISTVGGRAPSTLDMLRSRYPNAFGFPGQATSALMGFPSGAGGPAVREAFGAGVERGRMGAETPRSEAFTENMRAPENGGDDLVATARTAVQNLRDAASKQYQRTMQQFGREPAMIPMDKVLQRVADMKPRNFDAMLDAPNRPSQHVAWENMMSTVEDYAAKAAQDPSLLHPLAMDAFKQDLYDIGSKIGGAYDRDAARIAGTAYNAVRTELVKHDPVYANIMRNYENAAREAQKLEQTFGLAAARGKQVNTDTAARRLMSIMRNNANTNYGQRATLGGRLSDLDKTGTLMPTLAGQTVSSITPRGLHGVGAAGAAATAVAANPFSVPGLALLSPRMTGELAYGAGRAVGTGQRAIGAVTEAARPVAERLGELYSRYPTATLALSQGSNRLEDVDQDLRRKYGVSEDYAPMADYEGY